MSKQNKKSSGGYIQWRRIGDGFCPEGEIRLQPATGAGQFEITGFGLGMPMGLKPVDPATDRIVRVKDTDSDQIVNEISQFWTLGEKYAKHGVAHKRGFLLYGPPGSGKTCTIWQVAHEVIEKYDATVIHASDVSALGGVLHSVRSIEPDRKLVVVMEDVDQMVYNDEESLLDLLDGKNQIAGVVFLATTNYLKRLPGRIRNRPSRFDRVVKVGKPSAHLRREYIKSREFDLSEELLEQYVKDTEGLSLAHAKELLIGVHVLGLKYEDVLARIKEMAALADKEDEEQDQEQE